MFIYDRFFFGVVFENVVVIEFMFLIWVLKWLFVFIVIIGFNVLVRMIFLVCSGLFRLVILCVS